MATKTNSNKIDHSALQAMHPDLPFDDNSLGIAKTASTQSPDMAAQMAQLQESMKALQTANENLQRTNMALMGQPVQVQPTFGATDIDPAKLPDPVTDPQGYARGLAAQAAEVLNTRDQMRNHQNQQAEDMNNRVNAVWTKFAVEHPDYAKNQKLVEYASEQAVRSAKASGLDPQKYMFAATPTFFNDVIKVIDDMGVQVKAKEEEEVNRTAGIPGGMESGGRMSAGKDPDETRIPTLQEELRAWKEKTGYYL